MQDIAQFSVAVNNFISDYKPFRGLWLVLPTPVGVE